MRRFSLVVIFYTKTKTLTSPRSAQKWSGPAQEILQKYIPKIYGRFYKKNWALKVPVLTFEITLRFLLKFVYHDEFLYNYYLTKSKFYE